MLALVAIRYLDTPGATLALQGNDMAFTPSEFQIQFLRGVARFQRSPAVPIEQAKLTFFGRFCGGRHLLAFYEQPGVPLPFVLAETVPVFRDNPAHGRERRELVLRGFIQEHSAIIDRAGLENSFRRLPLRYHTLDGCVVIVELEEIHLVEDCLILTVEGQVIKSANPFDHKFPHYLVTPQGFAVLDDENTTGDVADGESRESLKKRAETYVRKNGYPGRNALAKKLKCPPASLSNAIGDSPYLTARKAECDKKARKIPMTEILLKETPQHTEEDPKVKALEKLIRDQELEQQADDHQAVRRQHRRRSPRRS